MKLYFIRKFLASIGWDVFFKIIWVSLGISIFLVFAAGLYGTIVMIGLFLSLVGRHPLISLFVVISILAMFTFRRVGLISLSSQSLAHRRNIFFAFLLVFLIENFGLDVTSFFRASSSESSESFAIELRASSTENSESFPIELRANSTENSESIPLELRANSTENSESIPIELAAKGILALFTIYSFIEYAHNFLFDFVRSRNDTQIITNPKFFRLPKTSDIWLVLIGNYRFLFDIVLPITISMFISVIYSEDVKSLFNVSIEYFNGEVIEYLAKPENNNIKDVVEIIVSAFHFIKQNFLEELK